MHIFGVSSVPCYNLEGDELMVTLQIRTTSRSQMVDITDRVAEALKSQGVQNGIAFVFVPHTTAGITINENADPDVVHDILFALDQCVPWRQNGYRHIEGNTAAHVKASMVGSSVSVLVRDGRMVLGTWQAIFLCEFDGPRTRYVYVSALQP
jgi:secondary thiamine-phosphate synthase enzyme